MYHCGYITCGHGTNMAYRSRKYGIRWYGHMDVPGKMEFIYSGTDSRRTDAHIARC
jgi:hypothetical protein